MHSHFGYNKVPAMECCCVDWGKGLGESDINIVLTGHLQLQQIHKLILQVVVHFPSHWQSSTMTRACIGNLNICQQPSEKPIYLASMYSLTSSRFWSSARPTVARSWPLKTYFMMYLQESTETHIPTLIWQLCLCKEI